MEKIDYIKRNCGVGKVAALPQLKDIVSFSKNPIRTTCVYHYYKFLKEYCNYDKVYLVSNIATLDESLWQCKNILKDFDIIYGISKPNLLNEYNIDDMYIIPSTGNYYGGTIFPHAPFNYNRITEWWLENKDNPDKHIFYIQDDPLFPNTNFAAVSIKRLFDTKNLACYGSKVCPQELVDEELKLLEKNRDNVVECFDNLTVAFCGNDYKKYWETIKADKRPKALGWDNFNCYLWNGVNDNLEQKLKDHPWEGKKYEGEYHGVTKAGKRQKKTEDMYSALDKPFMHIVGKSSFFNKLKEGEHFDKFGVVEYKDLLDLVCANAKAAFITHEPNILGNQVSPRFFDCMMGDIVALVDIAYDPNKELVDNDELKEFMYISTPQEFAEKVKKVSSDENYYRHIKKLQRQAVYKKFGELIEEKNKDKWSKFI